MEAQSRKKKGLSSQSSTIKNEFDQSAFEHILGEKRSIAARLEKIEQNRAKTTEKVYQKVKEEYSEKLSDMMLQLQEHQGFLVEAVRSLTAQRQTIESKISSLNEKLEELSFRRTIEEIEESYFEGEKAPLDQALAEENKQKEALDTKEDVLYDLYSSAFGEELVLDQVHEPVFQNQIEEQNFGQEEKNVKPILREIEPIEIQPEALPENNFETSDEDAEITSENPEERIKISEDDDGDDGWVKNQGNIIDVSPEDESPVDQPSDQDSSEEGEEFIKRFIEEPEDFPEIEVDGPELIEGEDPGFGISDTIENEHQEKANSAPDDLSPEDEIKAPSGSKRPLKAMLFISKGPDAGKRFVISDQQISLGRNTKNDIQVNDPEVSRKHALIGFENGQYVLKDNKSVNGCFINGARKEMAILKHQDEIVIGGTTLIFSYAES